MSSASAVQQQVEQLVYQLQAEGVLDEQFMQLMALQDDSNPDFVREVVQLYFEDSGGKIDKMCHMLQSGATDYNELDQLVHQFKGSSASLGAHLIAQLCIRLREQCQLHNNEGCVALVQQIRVAYADLKTKLEMFMQLEGQRRQLQEAGMH